MLNQRPAAERQRPLFEPVDPPSPPAARAIQNRPPPQPQRTADHRWMCLDFHRLPLEIFTAFEPGDAVAVIEPQGPKLIVVSVSDRAQALGVSAGMTVSAAQAVCPAMATCPRDTAAEQQRLRWLARRIHQFSSRASLEAPHTLYLEIAGSQRLLGKLPALGQQISDMLAAHGHRPRMAIAPTPRGAAWLARTAAGSAVLVENHEQLRRSIAALPIHALDLPPKHTARMARSGLHTVGDLLRLPRDGLARRFGQVVTCQLDQALGKAPHPLPIFELPSRFVGEADLPMPSAATPHIVAAAEHVLAQLCAHLRASDRGVDRVVCLLFHDRQPASRHVIGLRTACRDPQRIGLLLREHLDAHPLPGEVLALRIEAPRLLASASANMDWLNHSGSDDWLATVERWQARLGRDAVRRLGTHPDHRPEYAFTINGQDSHAWPTARRPVYLLAKPLPLQTRGHQPVCGGVLVRLSGPERIEQGWWDGADVSRDYYRMRDQHGAQLWIYQDRQRLGWWLHGLFA